MSVEITGECTANRKGVIQVFWIKRALPYMFKYNWEVHWSQRAMDLQCLYELWEIRGSVVSNFFLESLLISLGVRAAGDNQLNWSGCIFNNELWFKAILNFLKVFLVIRLQWIKIKITFSRQVAINSLINILHLSISRRELLYISGSSVLCVRMSVCMGGGEKAGY